jgi:site-specific recombinase XerD
MFNLKFMVMKRATFSLLFYIKRSKLLKNRNAPVYLKITINGKSAELSINRDIPPKLWDTSRNQAKGSSKEAQELNDYITSIRGQIFVHQRTLQESGKLVTAKALKNSFLGIGEKQWSLIELFEKHNSNMEQLIGKEYSPLTLQRFQAALKHIKGFCKAQYNQNDLLLSEIDHKFISGLEFHLKTTAGCQHNSAMKHIKALKKVIRIALANDYIRKDPFANYQVKIKQVDREQLTEEEIKKLANKEISIERVANIRDLFLFQCFTGLAYKDLAALSQDDLHLGIDGNKWIKIKRGKTGVACNIPLLPIAENLMIKYKNHPCRNTGKLFPVPSNQKMNAYLKEVADICGIKKTLHTHLARHTYATTVTLSNGVPIETVSKLLGHSKLQTTQIYAKVLDSKISEDVKILRQKILNS